MVLLVGIVVVMMVPISRKTYFYLERSLSLLLYSDDFEICNLLGTSHKKRKVTGVYCALTDTYLAALCKNL